MSFDTMMASATVSTITIAVAADRPPMKAIERDRLGMGGERQRHHEHVAVDAAGRKRHQAGERNRQHEQIDQHQIGGEQPGGAADLGLAVVLDHHDVELPRQQHDGEQRQHRHGAERRELRRVRQHRRGARLGERAREQRERAVEHDEGHEYADGEERHQLDDRFRRDRQHQAVLMLGGVGVAGAEQHREGRHRQRDKQRDVADAAAAPRRPARLRPRWSRPRPTPL